MKYYPLLIFAVLGLCAVKSAPAGSSATNKFEEFLRLHPEGVFVSTISQKTKDAVADYQTRKSLPNGLHYGDSVRTYSLVGKSVTEVRADMNLKGCSFKEDVIRAPEDNQPKFFAGHEIPIWIFLCPDGGVVRVKPQGDPTNPFRHQPHGNKSLRYPFDAKFENFSDEVVKVDPEGNAVPKSRADLAPQDLVDGWSQAAHADLKD